MFMHDVHIDPSLIDGYFDEQNLSEFQVEDAAYQELLNAADAARTGLASGEHDFDYPEEIAE